MYFSRHHALLNLHQTRRSSVWRLEIKAKHCTCKHWETVCSSQCYLDMISLVEYLARIRNLKGFDYGKQNNCFTDMRFLLTCYDTSESLSLD